MVTEFQMLSQIEAANQFIDKNYLETLKAYRVCPIDEHLKKHNLTRLFQINKIVYDKDEDISEKLVSVFHSVMPFCKNIILVLKGKRDSVDLYLGIRASQISYASTASEVLHDSFLGNFPGSKISAIKPSKIPVVFDENKEMLPKRDIAYVNILPCERSSGQGEFVQGLEKFIDTMRGNDYICEIIASPIQDRDIAFRMNGFEELYSALFPFSKKSSSHGHNKGITLTEGITESISNLFICARIINCK